jgi:hypothetical protein
MVAEWAATAPLGMSDETNSTCAWHTVRAEVEDGIENISNGAEGVVFFWIQMRHTVFGARHDHVLSQTQVEGVIAGKASGEGNTLVQERAHSYRLKAVKATWVGSLNTSRDRLAVCPGAPTAWPIKLSAAQHHTASPSEQRSMVFYEYGKRVRVCVCEHVLQGQHVCGCGKIQRGAGSPKTHITRTCKGVCFGNASQAQSGSGANRSKEVSWVHAATCCTQ